MLRQFATAFTLAVTLAATPAYAADTTGQPGRGGDGHCPIPSLPTDPDCAREDSQPYQEQAKSSRDEFPACRNWRVGQPKPPGCRAKTSEEDKRNQFPRTTPQPGHLG